LQLFIYQEWDIYGAKIMKRRKDLFVMTQLAIKHFFLGILAGHIMFVKFELPAESQKCTPVNKK